MLKKEVFIKEISYIKNENYRKNVELLLEKVPSYFFEIPASSTLKYHPSFALSSGGLIRHTKVAVRIAYELLNLECYSKKFDDRQKDLIIVSLIFHDSFKNGILKEEYTRFDHPLIAKEFFVHNKGITSFTDDDISFIGNAISSHMGQWNSSSYSNIVLPKPESDLGIFVHTCDFLASRKFINVDFKNNDIEG